MTGIKRIGFLTRTTCLKRTSKRHGSGMYEISMLSCLFFVILTGSVIRGVYMFRMRTFLKRNRLSVRCRSNSKFHSVAERMHALAHWHRRLRHRIGQHNPVGSTSRNALSSAYGTVPR